MLRERDREWLGGPPLPSAIYVHSHRLFCASVYGGKKAGGPVKVNPISYRMLSSDPPHLPHAAWILCVFDGLVLGAPRLHGKDKGFSSWPLGDLVGFKTSLGKTIG